MTQSEYGAIRAVNWSALKNLRISPKVYRYQLTHERADTTQFRIGRATHTDILEPDVFQIRHPLFPGASRRGKVWEAFVEQHPETDKRDILIESELESVRGCTAAVLCDLQAVQHLHAGVTEHVITWTDPDSGLACKGRCDSVNGHLVDLKTTAYINPRAFAGEAVRLGYHGQIAFYLDGLIANGMLDPETMAPPALVVVESEPPHDVVVWTVPPETVETGRCLYKRLLLRLVDCQTANEWPGVAPEPIPLVLPAWAVAELENEETETLTIGGVPLEV